jgi:hypothetical protein
MSSKRGRRPEAITGTRFRHSSVQCDARRHRLVHDHAAVMRRLAGPARRRPRQDPAGHRTIRGKPTTRISVIQRIWDEYAAQMRRGRS